MEDNTRPAPTNSAIPYSPCRCLYGMLKCEETEKCNIFGFCNRKFAFGGGVIGKFWGERDFKVK